MGSIKIDWSKDGQELQTSEQSIESRFSIERKKSEQRSDQTVVQLEIMEASIDDKGSYELVATSTEGEKQSQTVVLTEEAIVASLAAQPDEADGPKKKKKKIVKKKKRERALIYNVVLKKKWKEENVEYNGSLMTQK